jgi:hypothetical protein
LPGGELLERQIERHHLGDGSRITRAVGATRIQHLAGRRIDDDRGVLGLLRHCVNLRRRDRGR